MVTELKIKSDEKKVEKKTSQKPWSRWTAEVWQDGQKASRDALRVLHHIFGCFAVRPHAATRMWQQGMLQHCHPTHSRPWLDIFLDLKNASAVTTWMVGRMQEVDRKQMTQSASCARNPPSSLLTQKYDIYTRFSKSCLVCSCWMTLTHWEILQLIGPFDFKEIDQVFLISSPGRGVKARHTRVSNLLLQVSHCRVGRWTFEVLSI